MCVSKKVSKLDPPLNIVLMMGSTWKQDTLYKLYLAHKGRKSVWLWEAAVYLHLAQL